MRSRASEFPAESSSCPPPHSAHDGARHYPPPTEAFHQVGTLVAQLKEYATYFLSTKVDGVRASVRNTALYAVLGLGAALTAAAAIVTGVVLLIGGVATGLGWLFGQRFWLGNLVTGLLVLILFAAGAYVGLSYLLKSFRRNLVNKYEQRQQWERGQFGRDVRQAAQQSQ